MSVSFWNEDLNKRIQKWLVSYSFTLVSCGNRDELVLEQNSFWYCFALLPEHTISIALKQQPALNCYAATETTISDHKSNIL